MSALRRFVASGHLAAKAARFAGIGVLSGTIYAVVTALLVSRFGVEPIPASIVGYCLSVPASFIGHRQFSFRSSGLLVTDAIRFVVAQAINIAVTAGSMFAATHWLVASYVWGMLFAVILVPVANFIFMNLWVFRHQKDGMEVAL